MRKKIFSLEHQESFLRSYLSDNLSNTGNHIVVGLPFITQKLFLENVLKMIE